MNYCDFYSMTRRFGFDFLGATAGFINGPKGLKFGLFLIAFLLIKNLAYSFPAPKDSPITGMEANYQLVVHSYHNHL